MVLLFFKLIFNNISEIKLAVSYFFLRCPSQNEKIQICGENPQMFCYLCNGRSVPAGLANGPGLEAGLSGTF